MGSNDLNLISHEEAVQREKKKQEQIAEYHNLGWWYGTDCEKCCEVYPKLIIEDNAKGYCFYRCEVCGKRTEAKIMPWVAQEAWNRHEYKDEYQQMRMF